MFRFDKVERDGVLVITLFGGLDRPRIRQFGENRPVDGFGDRDEIDDFTHVVWHCADLSLYQLDQ